MTSHVEERLFIRHFGVGSEQFRRELEAELEAATPEQRAEFEELIDRVNAVLPQIRATVDRADASLGKMRATMHELRHGMATLDRRVADLENNLSSFEDALKR